MRTGARLRVSLEAESRAVGARDALQRAVEQGAMRRPQRRRQGGLVDRKPVILARDEHASRVELRHRVIGTVMAELHLHGLRAAREPEQLVAEANAEDRYVGLQEARDRLYGVIARLGITRSVT